MTENSIQTTIYDERKFRLPFLDGMRGITAFYVLLTHLWIYQGENHMYEMMLCYQVSYKFLICLA